MVKSIFELEKRTDIKKEAAAKSRFFFYCTDDIMVRNVRITGNIRGTI